MMIVMKPTATEEDILVRHRPHRELRRPRAPLARRGSHRDRRVGDREHVQRLGLEGHPGVEQVVPILQALQALLAPVPSWRAHA